MNEYASIPKFVTSTDTAARLNLTEQCVRKMFRNGKLAATQVGSQWVTTKETVDAWIESNQNALVKDKKREPGSLPDIRALSFFSGAMGLDLGLEKAGIDVLLACETNRHCRKTILLNRPELGLIGDIWAYTPKEVRSAAGLSSRDRIDVIVGGPPCQAFSTAGARRGFNDDRGNALLRYIEIILVLKPKYAVIENVRGLLSAPISHVPHISRDNDWLPSKDECRGGAMLNVLNLLKKGGYSVSFNLYNSANFGVPQQRERVILICHRGKDTVPHLMPTHSKDGQFGLPPWRTLREALDGLPSTPCDHLEFPEERLQYYRMLKSGQYWKHLPPTIQKKAMGASYYSGGGKTGFFRRLDWDSPSCTLVTSPCMPATDICHPEKLRPLSVQEYKRIQQFPNDWTVCGSLVDQYRQIGNAVPVGLGEAVGRAILAHASGKPISPSTGFPFSRYRNTDELTWHQTIGVASGKSRRRPALGAVSNSRDLQPSLFD